MAFVSNNIFLTQNKYKERRIKIQWLERVGGAIKATKRVGQVLQNDRQAK
jgi:hypothetical protein